MSQAFGEAAQQHGRIAGSVRLATAENLANPLIIPSLTTLFTRYPDLAHSRRVRAVADHLIAVFDGFKSELE